MNILITLLLAVAGIIILLLILALFMKSKHYVKREVIIGATRQQVFDYIKLLRNQDTFNENAKAGAGRKRHYKGTDGTVGFVYAWSGDKDAGEGEKEIMAITEGESIEMEIRFVKPMIATARIIMGTEPLSAGRTKVYWSNAGTLKYPLNALIPMVERSVAKGMDSSLSALKDILEKQPQ